MRCEPSPGECAREILVRGGRRRLQTAEVLCNAEIGFTKVPWRQVTSRLPGTRYRTGAPNQAFLLCSDVDAREYGAPGQIRIPRRRHRYVAEPATSGSPVAPARCERTSFIIAHHPATPPLLPTRTGTYRAAQIYEQGVQANRTEGISPQLVREAHRPEEPL